MFGRRFVDALLRTVDWMERLKDRATASLEPARDTATAVLGLPGADRCPPTVRIQMLVHYIERFDDVHLASRKKTIECVLTRMDRLNVERLRADVALRYERNELKKLKKHLALRNMDTRDAHTQTRSVRLARPADDHVGPTAARDVSADVRTVRVPKAVVRAYVCSRRSLAAVARLFKWIAACLEEPAALRTTAERMAGWSANLFRVDVRTLTANRTSVCLHVMPNVPRRRHASARVHFD